jgi:hypothetical protein
MRTDTVEYRSSGVVQQTPETGETPTSLMTPARRAALDALEREFSDLLKARGGSQ